MTEAEAATCTVEEVVMEKRSGEWDLSYYYGQPQEILDAMEPATDKWQTEVPLETPVFTRTDKGAHQMTTQPELEAFIENLDDADDNMYIFSIGKSATYDFDMPIVIEDYARQHHMTPWWFIQNFKKIAQVTPAQYLVSLRINHALSLLDHTDYAIAKVAAAVGYDNPLYFSRLFHKHVGCSPSAYKKQKERG